MNYYWIKKNGSVVSVPLELAVKLQERGSKIITLNKEYHWYETSHYFFSKNGTKCSHCGKKRKRLMRINYPKISNVPSQSYSYTEGYPENNPYNDWSCMKCWRSLP